MLDEEEEKIEEKVVQADIEVQLQEQRAERVIKSRNNQEYKKMQVTSLPRHLQKNETHKSLIARFRCRNETGGNSFCKIDESRKCRMCKEVLEIIDYLRVQK